jgi:hypothetical protein
MLRAAPLTRSKNQTLIQEVFMNRQMEEALNQIATQQAETAKIMAKLTKKLSRSAMGGFRPGYDDMRDAFNQVIDRIKKGSHEPINGTSIEQQIRDSVRLNRAWVEEADQTLTDFHWSVDEDRIRDAWLTVLQTYPTLIASEKKDASKFLDKKVKW